MNIQETDKAQTSLQKYPFMAYLSLEEREEFEKKASAIQHAVLQQMPRRQKLFTQSLQPIGRNRFSAQAQRDTEQSGRSETEERQDDTTYISESRQDQIYSSDEEKQVEAKEEILDQQKTGSDFTIELVEGQEQADMKKQLNQESSSNVMKIDSDAQASKKTTIPDQSKKISLQ